MLVKLLCGAFLVSLLSIPKSYSVYKFGVLCFIIALLCLGFVSKRFRVKSIDPIVFYFTFSAIAIVWLMIGIYNGGRQGAIDDGMRLYVAFSFIYCFLVMAALNFEYHEWLIRCLVWSSVIISALTFLIFLDAIFHIGILPSSFKDELQLNVGLHDSYSQVGSNNINSLFFVLPALISYWMFGSEGEGVSQKIVLMCIFLGILAAMLSGRRALLLVVLLTPVIAGFQYSYVERMRLSKSILVRTVALLAVMTIVPIALIGYFYYHGNLNVANMEERIYNAFGGDTVRVNQFYSLLSGFENNYLFGSGFGGVASVIRSQDRPWMYELSYMQLLFNGGLFGTAAIMGLITTFYIKAIRAAKNNRMYKSENVALLTGFVAFCIGNATNPYFSGFDSLIIIGLLPLLAATRPASGNQCRRALDHGVVHHG